MGCTDGVDDWNAIDWESFVYTVCSLANGSKEYDMFLPYNDLIYFYTQTKLHIRSIVRSQPASTQAVINVYIHPFLIDALAGSEQSWPAGARVYNYKLIILESYYDIPLTNYYQGPGRHM